MNHLTAVSVYKRALTEYISVELYCRKVGGRCSKLIMIKKFKHIAKISQIIVKKRLHHDYTSSKFDHESIIE